MADNMYIQGMKDLKEALLDKKFIEDNYGCDSWGDVYNILTDFNPEEIVYDYRQGKDPEIDDKILSIDSLDIRTALGISDCSLPNQKLTTKEEILKSVKFWYLLALSGNKQLKKIKVARDEAYKIINELTVSKLQELKWPSELSGYLNYFKTRLKRAINNIPNYDNEDDGI
jgi:hypothetical protein